jgi:hypothetical protein
MAPGGSVEVNSWNLIREYSGLEVVEVLFYSKHLRQSCRK